MTPYYDREKWPGFLAAIKAAPTDDLPRLVAADFLEENGEPERAEFVRVQCSPTAKTADIARILGGTGCERWATAGIGQADNWAWSGGLMTCYDDPVLVATSVGATLTYSRGFVSRVRARLAVLCGGECVQCAHLLPHMAWSSADDYCPACHGIGSTPGVLRELLRREPLRPEGIEVTDMPIFPSSGNSTYYVGGLGRMPREYWGQLDSLPSESAARTALSRAVYAVCSPESEVTT